MVAMMKNDSWTRTLLGPLGLGLLLPVGVLSYSGCKKDEPPPPMPAATSANTRSAPLVLEVEDSGPVADNGDAEADVKKVGYAPTSSMQACCAALQQNAASAPPPTNVYMMTAAAACSAAVAQGKDKSSISSVVSGALRGAGMPAACSSPSTTPSRQAPSRHGGSSV